VSVITFLAVCSHSCALICSGEPAFLWTPGWEPRGTFGLVHRFSPFAKSLRGRLNLALTLGSSLYCRNKKQITWYFDPQDWSRGVLIGALHLADHLMVDSAR
jgi:hypothetical protein